MVTTHSSFLAWKIPWTEEPGRVQWGLKEWDTAKQLIGAEGNTEGPGTASSEPLLPS